MDLHHLDAQPTDAERRAVDALLGPPASSWEGATDRPDRDLRLVHGGESARRRRHLLLPALDAVQSAIGWISPGALSYVCRRLSVPPADAYGVASFYALLALEDQPDRIAHVCDDIACRTRGAAAVIDGLDGRADWRPSPCLGRCDAAPAVFFQIAGEDDATLAPAGAGAVIAALDGERPEPPGLRVPQAGDPSLRLLRRVGEIAPDSLDAYRKAGGYQALRAAVAMGPQAVIREVKVSGLKGRGGAAFPTGIKWEGAAAQPVRPHYLICNADESEPGTFKDRVVMEGDPFALLESMTIAAYATACEKGYVYIRGEYPEATTTLQQAIDIARRRGLLGEDVMGAGFAFDVEIRRGQGAYICGEETALMNSIEGYRGEPRQKPPFPTEAGLFGKPTVINNVETLLNVPDIVLEGGAAYARLGTPESTGTRLFCLSGAVAAPGVYEVEMGTTLGALLELAGGPTGDLRTILLGGAAGSFVGTDLLDLPLTFEDTRRHGLTLGSGVVMAFDTSVDMGDVVARIAAFFRDESCGQCVPCRVGTVRLEEAVARHLRNGDGPLDLELVDDIVAVMSDASICGLGFTAGSAVRSAIELGLVGT